jgi:hypothetical protein
VDQSVINKRLADLTKLNVDAAKVKVYNNYKALLDQKDIDISIFKKKSDSLVNRLYYYQIKLQNLKDVTDTSKNY